MFGVRRIYQWVGLENKYILIIDISCGEKNKLEVLFTVTINTTNSLFMTIVYLYKNTHCLRPL